MIKKSIIVSAILLLFSSIAFADGKKYSVPVSRKHTKKEVFLDASFMYGVHWAGYILMFKVIHDENGNFETYKENLFFNNMRWWDGDSILWNFIGHPYTGSQTYLYYRGRGYSKAHSFYGSFLASFLFESTIEILDQSFSFNDAIITPGLGFLLGNYFEKASLKLINSDSRFKRAIARIINLSLNFENYEGIEFIPVISKDMSGGILVWRF